MIISPPNLVATGARLRQLLDEQGDACPTVNLARLGPELPAISRPRVIRPVMAEAAFSRDTGYFSIGAVPDPRGERALHLRIAYLASEPGPEQTYRPHDHNISDMLCAGFFGEKHLPFVLCHAQNPFAGRNAGRWHFRLFVMPDWKTPAPSFRTDAFLSWGERRRYVERRQQAGV